MYYTLCLYKCCTFSWLYFFMLLIVFYTQLKHYFLLKDFCVSEFQWLYFLELKLGWIMKDLHYKPIFFVVSRNTSLMSLCPSFSKCGCNWWSVNSLFEGLLKSTHWVSYFNWNFTLGRLEIWIKHQKEKIKRAVYQINLNWHFHTSFEFWVMVWTTCW